MLSDGSHQWLSQWLEECIKPGRDVKLFPLAISSIKDRCLLKKCCSLGGINGDSFNAIEQWNKQTRDLLHASDLIDKWKGLCCVVVSCDQLTDAVVLPEIGRWLLLINAILSNARSKDQLVVDALQTAKCILQRTASGVRSIDKMSTQDPVIAQISNLSKNTFEIISQSAASDTAMSSALGLLVEIQEHYPERKQAHIARLTDTAMLIILTTDASTDTLLLQQASRLLVSAHSSSSKAQFQVKWITSLDRILESAGHAIKTTTEYQHLNGRDAISTKLDSIRPSLKLDSIPSARVYCNCMTSAAFVLLSGNETALLLPTNAIIDLLQRGLDCICTSMQQVDRSATDMGQMLNSISSVLQAMARLHPSSLLAHRSRWIAALLEIMDLSHDHSGLRLNLTRLLARLSELLTGNWIPQHVAERFCQVLCRDCEGELLYWNIKAFHGILTSCESSTEISYHIARVLHRGISSLSTAGLRNDKADRAWYSFLLWVANNPEHGAFARQAFITNRMRVRDLETSVEALIHPSLPAIVTSAPLTSSQKRKAQSEPSEDGYLDEEEGMAPPMVSSAEHSAISHVANGQKSIVDVLSPAQIDHPVSYEESRPLPEAVPDAELSRESLGTISHPMTTSAQTSKMSPSPSVDDLGSDADVRINADDGPDSEEDDL